ncbi:MAG TPA: head GIN domain-containing protein [Puia sp.]|jgi:hypothetical protein|nr:head GIN domain-containing protein [Puia sp.]
MRKTLLLFAIVLLALAGAAQKTVVHDPNAQVRPVKGFHGIEVSDAIDLYLSPGDQEMVVVSAKDIKWRDRIQTEVVDGILRISLPHHGWSVSNIKAKAYVSYTTLDRLGASGSSDIFVDGVITGSQFSIDLSGASDFKGALNVRQLLMTQSGASDAQLTGVVSGVFTVRSSGASHVKGLDLVTESCSVHATGASDIRITVNKELSAELSGASSVFYKGEGVVREMHSSGASSIKKIS